MCPAYNITLAFMILIGGGYLPPLESGWALDYTRSDPLWLTSIWFCGEPSCHTGRKHRRPPGVASWRRSGWQPLQRLSPPAATLDLWEERSLQLIPAATGQVTPAYSLPDEAPDCRADSSSPCSALSQFSTHTICELNKMPAVLYSQVWGGFFHSSRQLGRSLVPFLSAVDTGGLFRQERMLLRF